MKTNKLGAALALVALLPTTIMAAPQVVGSCATFGPCLDNPDCCAGYRCDFNMPIKVFFGSCQRSCFLENETCNPDDVSNLKCCGDFECIESAPGQGKCGTPPPACIEEAAQCNLQDPKCCEGFTCRSAIPGSSQCLRTRTCKEEGTVGCNLADPNGEECCDLLRCNKDNTTGKGVCTQPTKQQAKCSKTGFFCDSSSPDKSPEGSTDNGFRPCCAPFICNSDTDECQRP